MFDRELIQATLRKIQKALETILQRAETIHTSNDFLTTPSGVERLESICMLLIAIGESVKQIDKLTNKTWLTSYPEVDWKGVMGMRDIIAHHYFDIDAGIVFEVIKNQLPVVKSTIDRMLLDNA